MVHRDDVSEDDIDNDSGCEDDTDDDDWDVVSLEDVDPWENAQLIVEEDGDSVRKVMKTYTMFSVLYP